MIMLGYDPAYYHTRRAPIETGSQGTTLDPNHIVFRINLVSLPSANDGLSVMDDCTSDHISNADVAELLADIRYEPGINEIEFHHGVGDRHLMVRRGGPGGMRLTLPVTLWLNQLRHMCRLEKERST
jgi:2,3-bisphosphoglycerate-independent phosphoglycerate mutase